MSEHALTIVVCANGYSVGPYGQNGDQAVTNTAVHVFESFEGMVEHLNETLEEPPAYAASRTAVRKRRDG